MGWDVWLTVRLPGHEDPVRRFKRLCDERLGNPAYRDVIRLFVRRGRFEVGFDGFPIERYLLEEWRRPIDPTRLAALPARYAGQDMAIEGWWEVTDRWQQNQDTHEAEPSDYRVIVTVLGEAYEWPSLRGRATDLVYNAGDYKNFWPSLGGAAARKNIDALVTEAAWLVAQGASEIRGLDAERSIDPCDAWLCYHRDANGFRVDIDDMTSGSQRSQSVSASDVLDAALECETLTFHETAGGLIIYSSDGPEGRLEEFYRRLVHRTT